MNCTYNWITSPKCSGTAAFTFQKKFSVRKDIKKAVLCASSIGIYCAYINGVRVGNGVLTPGFTSYKKRVQYQTYDVTELLLDDNIIEIGVGQGWAVGYIGCDGDNHYYADHTSIVAWLEVQYVDNSKEVISTDEEWEVFTSSVTYSEIYHGETVDMTALIEFVGHAVLADVDTELVPQIGEWIVEQERIIPVNIIHTPKGERVIDFGQNMTGYVEVSILAPRGSRIVLDHAEVLDKDGNFYNDNYRTARNKNTYICSGKQDTFKPTYSFQGFRYVRLTEYPFETVDPACFCAIAVYSDIKRTGSFICGNDKINQLYHNIIWGQKSNYLDIPTDCPQRDERLGWTGDAQVFCRTAAINFDVEKFLNKWLEDMALEQSEDGAIGCVVPSVIRPEDNRISAAWGDAACVIPWELYMSYGNRGILERNYPMMKKWVDYIYNAGPEKYLWLEGFHFGDWLALDAGADSYIGATSTDLIASAFYAHSLNLLIKAGVALGKDMKVYLMLYENVRNAFRAYFMQDGMLKEEFPMTQTSLVLILRFDLCEASEKRKLVTKLVELIRGNGDRMSTGFVGTPYLLHVLSDNGFIDVAYELLFQEKSPSWLYSVNQGATTMWEHWNGIKENGSFWSDNMNSFNHYAYGAVFDWIFSVCCGIKMCEEGPGYSKVCIEPHPEKRLGFVDTAIDTRNGNVRVHWYYKNGTVYYEIDIAKNIVAQVTLPSGYRTTISGGVYHFAENEQGGFVT